LGRYNEIEKYKEWSFIKHLEKAIKDQDHNYVYLLDEMNLSHIEQYFAQYLSAIEELNSDNAWIHVWEVLDLDENNSNKIYTFHLNEQFNIELSKRDWSWKKWDEFIRALLLSESGEVIIESNKTPTDFYRLLMRYFIDNYEDIDSVFNKIDDWKFWNYANNDDYEEYNGYYYKMALNTLNKIKEIKKIASNLDENILNNIIFTFRKNNINDNKIIKKSIIEHKNKKWEVIWKSLKIPKNLFVVGTINLDETTKSISPKVVDRANLIEFNDLEDFLFIKDNNKYDLEFLDNIFNEIDFDKILKIREYIANFKWNLSEFDKKYLLSKNIQDSLNKLYQFLKVFKLHFSYRTLKEIIIFINIWKELLNWKNIENKLFDIAVMQKVLPKLNWIIDYNFKLYYKKDDKDYHLSYDINNIDNNSVLKEFENIIKDWFYNENDNFKNSSIKLKRMQQFFDTYQNVNYFLS